MKPTRILIVNGIVALGLLAGASGCDGPTTAAPSPAATADRDATPAAAAPVTAAPSAAFTGTFQGGLNGARCVITLQQVGQRINGKIDKIPVTGTVSGDTATGPVVDPESGVRAGTFTMVETPGGIEVSLALKDPDTGVTVNVPPVPFARRAAGESTALAGDRDARLVGTWLYTEVFNSGGTTLVIDHRLVLGPDGSCSRSSRGAGGSEQVGIDLPDTTPTNGRWHTEDKVLYTSNSVEDEPDPLGRYICDGQRMMVTYPGGGKRVWERQ